MPSPRYHGLLAGFLGLAPWSLAAAQGLPDPLPPLPADSSPRVIPTSPVVHVPPWGLVPGWTPPAIDPIATATHEPKHVQAKSRSWHWRRKQGKLLGYPEEFRPRPLGSSIHEFGRVMVANGASARLVLYRYDFVDGTAQLNERGLDQLAKVAAQMAASPYPLLIERTPEAPALADARRAAVVSALSSGPMPIDPGRVLVGSPIPRGMSGIDAQIIGSNALDRVKDYGPPIPIHSNGVNSPSGVTIGR